MEVNTGQGHGTGNKRSTRRKLSRRKEDEFKPSEIHRVERRDTGGTGRWRCRGAGEHNQTITQRAKGRDKTRDIENF